MTVLELLSDHEVELALSVYRIVESPSPVNSEKSDHRQEDSHTHTGRPLDLERIEIPDVRPAVTSLKEEQCIDCGLRLKDNRISELYSKLIIDITGILVTGRAVL